MPERQKNKEREGEEGELRGKEVKKNKCKRGEGMSDEKVREEEQMGKRDEKRWGKETKEKGGYGGVEDDKKERKKGVKDGEE